MDNYKNLNKELVEQVQDMRVSLQEYREEILRLRAKCMASYESNVFLRTKCQDFALLHCQQYLELLDPESSVLAFINERVQLQGDTLKPCECQESVKSNPGMRQSRRLSLEYRRSSSFSQTKRSFNTTSPIRTPSCTESPLDDGAGVEPEVESSTMLTYAIPEEDELLQQAAPAVEHATATDLRSSYLLDISNNLCPDEATPESSSGPLSLISTVEVNAQEYPRVLRNITNRKCRINTSQDKSITTRKAKTDSANSVTEGFSLVCSPESDSAPGRRKSHITISRGKFKADRKSNAGNRAKRMGKENPKRSQTVSRMLELEDAEDNIVQQINLEESIQEARHLTRSELQIEESFNLSNEDDNASASSNSLADLTLSQFKNATGSTPKQVDSHLSPDCVPRHSSRPKRSCRPKSLVERSVRSKLRNESGGKSLSKGNK